MVSCECKMLIFHFVKWAIWFLLLFLDWTFPFLSFYVEGENGLLGSGIDWVERSPKLDHQHTLYTAEVGWGRKDESVGRMFYNLKTSFSSRESIPADIKSEASESICLHSLSLFLSQRVFVWDLDETIIIFHSLLTGTFASRYGKVRTHLSLFFSSMTLCAADLPRELWGQFMRQLL